MAFSVPLPSLDPAALVSGDGRTLASADGAGLRARRLRLDPHPDLADLPPRDAPLVLTTTSGRLDLQIGARPRRGARVGTVSTVSATHLAAWSWPERVEVDALALSPERLVSAAAEVAQGDPVRVALRPRVGVVDAVVAHLVAAALALAPAAGDPTAAPLLDALAGALALRLVREHADLDLRPDACTGGVSAATLRRVEGYVRAHLDTAIGLDDLAGAAGLSRYHFCREFKRSTGETPLAYVQRLRMEAAALHLRQTGVSVAAVALDVGYQSPSRFAGAFRRHTGASPSAYRRAVA